MTNKKFKIAAMSMALTACVAAQPLAANAAAPEEVKEPVSNANESESPTVEEPVVQNNADEGEPSADGANQEAEKTEEAFGEDVEVKYDPSTKREDPADGSTTIDGTIVKNEETEGESEGKGEGQLPETDGGKTDEGKMDSFDGNATKTETPEETVKEDPVPNPGAEPVTKTETEVKPDGTTIITNTTTTEGTQTTTTTGSGTATGETTEEKHFDEIDLNEELGEDPNIAWDVKEGTEVGKNGYKVGSVETTEDGKQTLTLIKEDEPQSGEMTAEDIAKLVDADRDSIDKKEDGSYTLKRTEEVRDEKTGKTITRTTYITVKDSNVTIKTTTTLTVTREKEEHHEEGSETVSNNFELPDITITDKETNESEKITSAKLKELLEKVKADPTASGKYTVVEGSREYTITVDKEASHLNGDALAQKLREKLGENFTADGDRVFYVDANGEKWELNIEQTAGIREILSYTVDVKEKNKGETVTVGKDEAEANAKDEAVRNALKAAVDKLLESKTISEDEAKQLKDKIDKDTTLNADAGGTFETKVGGKSFTLDYKAGTITSTDETRREDKDNDKTTENKDHTVNGSSYVSSGRVEWTDGGTGSGEHFEFKGDQFTAPDNKYLTGTEELDGGKVKKTYTVVSEDGKTTTVYEVIEETVELTESEKEDLAWKQLEEKLGQNREDLKKAGYSISNVTFDGGIKKIDWKITETVKGTDEKKEDLNKTIHASGSQNWNIDEKTNTITVNGETYKNVKKNSDGSYTCTREENGQKVTYTFTKNDNAKLSDGDIKKLLAEELVKELPNITADDITLSDDGKTASCKDGDKTITIDYSSLKKGLTVEKEVHQSSSVTDVIESQKDLDAAYDKLWEEIETIRDNLNPGEELWVGDLKVTDKTEKTDIIKYITKAISPEDMSKEELIKALREQERIAKETDVTVNEGKTDKNGNSFEETLKNYYSGIKEGDYYVKEDGSLVPVWKDRDGNYYYGDWHNKTKVDAADVINYKHADDIGHLDLASGSQLELLPDEKGESKTTDCVLIRDGLTLEWNYDADDLVKGIGNTTVGLDSKISYDRETGNETGHYEYDRGSPNNKPNKSAFYKLTGTVAYDAVTEKDENGKEQVKLFEKSEAGKQAAVNAYLEAVGRKGESYESLFKTSAGRTELDKILKTYVVELGHTTANQDGPIGYQVYTKTSTLEAYGYMTRDANTCVNQTYERQYDSFHYLGGYDLMISKLVQVREGKVIGQTESTIKTITAPWSIRTRQELSDSILQLGEKTTFTPTSKTTELGDGVNSTTAGRFGYDYAQKHDEKFENWTKADTEGIGHGNYTSFVKWAESLFSGKSDEMTKDDGSFTYKYDYTTISDLEAKSKTQTIEKKAEISYKYKTVEVRDVDIIDKEVTVIEPEDDDPTPPIIPGTPDETPVSPAEPELPPVQDAKPETPVLPTAAVLPAVQDAHALPQTGVNWLTAIAMAVSGFTLMAAGAFASLTGKNAKH